MAKWLLVVGSNCADAARETEFNEWYEKTHLPDVLETLGIKRKSPALVSLSAIPIEIPAAPPAQDWGQDRHHPG